MKRKKLYYIVIVTIMAALWSGSILAQSQVTINMRATTSAETSEANPNTVDASTGDVQVQKTSDGNDKESYLLFDISSIETEYLSYAAFQAAGGQHNKVDDVEQPLINPYYVDIYACEDTSWSREDLTWNTAQSFTIGETLLGTVNMTGFDIYEFYSPGLVNYIKTKKENGATHVAFKAIAREEQSWDCWMAGSWADGASNLILTYSEPYKVVGSITTAETNKATPASIDAADADVQVWKTEDGSEEREAYVKFDVSEVSAEYLKYAVISCYAGQHNKDEEENTLPLIEANWVQVYSCEETNWSRSDLTWNIAKDFTIGEEPLTSLNIQGYNASYKYSSPEIAQYIIDAKAAGNDTIAFKFVARDAQDFDTWMSGSWEGMKLTVYQGDRDAEAVQDHQTGEAYAASPNSIDQNPDDVMVQRTDDGLSDYEGFVSFDISSIESPSLVYASIAFQGAQHVADGDTMLDNFMVDLYPLKNTDWTVDSITWNATRGFNYIHEPVASVNIWDYNDGDIYYFLGKELAGYINSQVELGNTKVAFIIKGREATPWDVWLTADWNGMHLSWADPSQALPTDDESPTQPGDLTAIAGITSITISWTASIDNRGVDGYKVYKADELVATLGNDITSYTFIDLDAETEYTLAVEAYDKAGNVSAKAEKTVMTQAPAFDISIDGVLDSDWDKFESRQIDNPLGVEDGNYLEPNSDNDCSGEFRLAWSPDGLYLWTIVKDGVRDTDDFGTSDGYFADRVEVFIDPDNAKSAQQYVGGELQFSFIPTSEGNIGMYKNGNNRVTDDAKNLVEYVIVDNGANYIFEAMIPWSALGVALPPTDSSVIGFEIVITDNDRDEQASDRESVVGWFEEEVYAWNQPNLWGELQLLPGGNTTTDIVYPCDDYSAPTMIDSVFAVVDTNSVTLNWTPSTHGCQLKRYEVLDENLETVVASKDTFVTLTDLADSTYYFTVVAYNVFGEPSPNNLTMGTGVVEVTIDFEPTAIKNEIVDVNIYPVPASDKLTVSYGTIMQKVTVTSLSGQVLFSVPVINQDEVSLDISNLSSGVYMLSITNLKGQVQHHKIMKK